MKPENLTEYKETINLLKQVSLGVHGKKELLKEILTKQKVPSPYFNFKTISMSIGVLTVVFFTIFVVLTFNSQKADAEISTIRKMPRPSGRVSDLVQTINAANSLEKSLNDRINAHIGKIAKRGRNKEEQVAYDIFKNQMSVAMKIKQEKIDAANKEFENSLNNAKVNLAKYSD